MPTLQQLPEAQIINTSDMILIEQLGSAKIASFGTLLSGAQPKLTLAQGTLLGRSSPLSGSPEPINVGPGLTLLAGNLAADTTILAPVASPAFTGTPTGPTPSPGDSSGALATTAFVGTSLASAAAAGSTVTSVAGRTGAIVLTTSDVSGLKLVASTGTYSDLIALPTTFAPPVATATVLGGVKTGTGLIIAADGTLSALGTGVTTVAGRSGAVALSTADISGLATVAASGSFTDLANKPTIPATYILPSATSAALGGVKAGPGVNIAADGTLSTAASAVTSVSGRTGSVLLTATDVFGLATIATSGAYSDLIGRPVTFVLPVASTSALGGVKMGAGVSIAADGTLSVAAAGVTTVAGRNGAVVLLATDIAGLATVASSGNYTDLSNKPAIPNSYSLPPATSAVLGGVKAGAGISVSADGTLSIPASSVMSVAGRGGAVVLSVSDISGLAPVATSGSYTDLSNKPTNPGTYVLPPATTGVLGGVKAGAGTAIAADGTLSVSASSVTAVAGRTGAVVLSAADISGLAGVATSGSYTDLSNRPATPSGYVLPAATVSLLGGVKTGSNLSAAADGTLSVNPVSMDTSATSVKPTTGTVARTLASRFNEVVNVLDYGAKLDGTTDDLAAFIAAQSAAQARGGALIVIPSGKPYLSGTVYTVSANGWLIYPGVTFMGPGQIVGVTDQILSNTALALAKFSAAPGNETGLFLSTFVGATSSPASYEKNGLYVRVIQSDPSTTTINRDAVAGEFQAYIQNGNTSGRIWAINPIATVNSGADGYCIGAEIAVENSGPAQPLVDQVNSKFGINLISGGVNNTTAAVIINNGTSLWQTGLFIKDTAIADKALRVATAVSGQWSDVASIDRAGNAIFKSLSVGLTPLAGVALSGSYADLSNKPVIPNLYNLPITTTYTSPGPVAVSDNLAVLNLNSAGSMSLPAGVTDGKQLVVKRLGAAVTLTGTLDGVAGASISLASPSIKESLTVVWSAALATWLTI